MKKYFEITIIVASAFAIMEAKDAVGDDKKLVWKPWKSHESDLRHFLMSEYDKSAKPFRSTNVSFFPTIKHFDMNEKMQSLDLDVWLTINWVDPRLMWNRTEHNWVRTLAFHHGEIWEPDISVFNNAEIKNIDLMGSNRLEVRYDGLVLKIPPAHIKAACVMDMTYWPYDTHNCTVKFGSWVYDGTAVNLRTMTDKPNIDIHRISSGEMNLTRGEWRLMQARLVRNKKKFDCCPEPYVDVDLSLLLHREAPVYAWTVQLPIIVFSLLTCVVFILPPGAPEKLIFGGMCLMVNFFMLTYSSNIIQANPSHTPLLVELIGQQLKLTAGSVFICGVVVRLVRAPYIMTFPNYLRRVIVILSALFCLGRYIPTIIRHSSSGNGSVLSRSTTITAEDVEMGDNGSATLYPQEQKHGRIFASSPADWMMLGAIIDRICLIAYIAILTVFLTKYNDVL